MILLQKGYYYLPLYCVTILSDPKQYRYVINYNNIHTQTIFI